GDAFWLDGPHPALKRLAAAFDPERMDGLLLREAMETPGKRAALITPDRDLARRVAAELARLASPLMTAPARPWPMRQRRHFCA
ncbi:MAG: hypothetical protein ACKOC9_18855, partial [Alphaproteobacteria bacterium]